ncbi:MAG: single-stranded DNA-binding protein [Bacteroidales bacterium]|jgi:single-strand DNA-binding protein|nr:single-stranded DNA-binding protein [Bacteroidales bacterium]
MAGINKVILIGNLGKDPEVFTFENGNKKVSFSLATTESFKNKEGARVDRTEWHNIVLYRGLADVAVQYLKKGQTIYLEGSIRTRSYDNSEGRKVYVTEIEGSTMTMLGGKRPEGDAPQAAPTSTSSASESADLQPAFDPPADDLPF